MLHHYVQLVTIKVIANLQAEVSRHYLNYLWWVLEPLLHMLIFYIVFGLLLQRGTENFVAYLLTGLIPWLWFNRTISNSMMSIVQGRGLMMQVHLPKIILPTIVIFQDVVKQTIVMVLLILFLWLYGIPLNIYWTALPVIIVTQLIFICACSYFVAALIPFLPDFKFLVAAGLQMLMFCSGVFYSTDVIPQQYRQLFFMNPMANLINNYRNIFLYGQWPDWHALLLISLISFVFILIMILIIKKLDYIYPRVVL
jgi:lipopolysaccharide transport system permease protein